MTVILEQYTVAEAGIIEIQQIVNITVNCEAAQRSVSRWLFCDVSMMLSALEPVLIIGEPVRWRIPVCFSTPDRGAVGIVGHVTVNAQTGEFTRTAESIETLLHATRKLARSLPPFQVKETPTKFLATELQPTHKPGRPTGNPIELIHG